MAKEIKATVEITEGVTANLDGTTLTVSGKAGEVKRDFFHPVVDMKVDNNTILITAKKSTKRELKLVKTFAAHMRNMVKGAAEGSKYSLKVCSGHFPMTVEVKGDELVVKNFYGEKIPRVLKIKEGAKVTVEGDQIHVEAPDKELASQVAASIEKLTLRSNFDRRIFQDGIWITSKDGNELK